MEKIAHDMRAYGFEEKSDFKGLIPVVNENLPVIGLPEEEVIISTFDNVNDGAEPLEVADINEIMADENGGSGSGSAE